MLLTEIRYMKGFSSAGLFVGVFFFFGYGLFVFVFSFFSLFFFFKVKARQS